MNSSVLGPSQGFDSVLHEVSSGVRVKGNAENWGTVTSVIKKRNSRHRGVKQPRIELIAGKWRHEICTRRLRLCQLLSLAIFRNARVTNLGPLSSYPVSYVCLQKLDLTERLVFFLKALTCDPLCCRSSGNASTPSTRPRRRITRTQAWWFWISVRYVCVIPSLPGAQC